MTFHSFDFLAFLVVTLAAYWCLPHRAQNVFLLAASYLFYGWVHPWFLTLIAASTVIDYAMALAMERWPRRRGTFLGISLATNLGMLGFFKYFNFFVDNVVALAAGVGLELSRPVFSIVLPVGISFYTFQTLSYTIDVYRGQLAARKRLLDVALFVSFFPQLVAGPIERAATLLPQVERERSFSVRLARDACLLVLWGFFKKLVIADNVGVVANKVFGLDDPGFFVLWAGVFAFGMQIYADFSAYSDIARGTARLFGVELMRNFDHPYLAVNPVDFWRRWHISLSTWFRDYVYIPCGGGRGGQWLRSRNLLITFLLSGLWHGASWNYVIWGLYHGLLVVGYHAWRAWRPADREGATAWPVAVAQGVLMFALVHVGWLLFRETDTGYLLKYLQAMPWSAPAGNFQAGAYLSLNVLAFAWPIFAHDWLSALLGRREIVLRAHHPERPPAAELRVALAQGLIGGVLLTAILVLHSRTSMDFIYFQF